MINEIIAYCLNKGYIIEQTPEQNCTRLDIKKLNEKTIIKIFTTGTIFLQGPECELKNELKIFEKSSKNKISTKTTINSINPHEPITQNKTENTTLQIFTDGACSGNPGRGATACIFVENNTIIKEFSEFFLYTTNNIMELTSILHAVENLPPDTICELTTDSKYAIQMITTNANAKVNYELITKIKNLIIQKNLNIKFNWVKGHAGNKYNQHCDDLARKTINNKKEIRNADIILDTEREPTTEELTHIDEHFDEYMIPTTKHDIDPDDM